MLDTAQASAEKAYPIQKESPYATNYIAAAKQEGYVLGWTESQREPISDAEVEAVVENCDPLLTLAEARAILEYAAQARVSAESEKG